MQLYKTKQPNLKLKTQPKQLLGSLPLAFAFPALAYFTAASATKKKVFKTLVTDQLCANHVWRNDPGCHRRPRQRRQL